MIICEAFFLIFGLYAVFAGKIPFTNQERIDSHYARLIGFVMLAPLAIGICGGLYVGWLRSSSYTPVTINDIGQVTTLEMIGMIIAVIVSLYFGATAPEPRRRLPSTLGTSRFVPAAPPKVTQDTPLRAVMTLAEAASYLRVSEADVTTLIETGQLTARQVGMEYRISKESLENFLNKR